jgi:hypothetical protein
VRGLLEPEPGRRARFFDLAYRVYRSFLYACSHASLTSVLEDLPSTMEAKLTMFTPFPGIEEIAPSLRRQIAQRVSRAVVLAVAQAGTRLAKDVQRVDRHDGARYRCAPAAPTF